MLCSLTHKPVQMARPVRLRIGLPNEPAQRAGRIEPRAEAAGRCPGVEGRQISGGPKGRETDRAGVERQREFSRPYRPLQMGCTFNPRASACPASALGSVLPARWAGFGYPWFPGRSGDTKTRVRPLAGSPSPWIPCRRFPEGRLRPRAGGRADGSIREGPARTLLPDLLPRPVPSEGRHRPSLTAHGPLEFRDRPRLARAVPSEGRQRAAAHEPRAGAREPRAMTEEERAAWSLPWAVTFLQRATPGKQRAVRSQAGAEASQSWAGPGFQRASLDFGQPARSAGPGTWKMNPTSRETGLFVGGGGKGRACPGCPPAVHSKPHGAR